MRTASASTRRSASRSGPEPEFSPPPPQVDRLVADMPMLRKTYGKMVYELRPSVDWHKVRLRVRVGVG